MTRFVSETSGIFIVPKPPCFLGVLILKARRSAHKVQRLTLSALRMHEGCHKVTEELTSIPILFRSTWNDSTSYMPLFDTPVN